jgi:hypothetical protein
VTTETVWTSPWFEGYGCMPPTIGEMTKYGDFTHLRIDEEKGESYCDGLRFRVITLRQVST